MWFLLFFSFILGQPSLVSAAPNPPEPTPLTTKMMFVGDSLSHGAEYDWTWRWRLADWLEYDKNQITFVGPYVGTNGPPPAAAARPNPPLFLGEVSKTYPEIPGLYHDQVPSSFASMGHASTWGRAAVQSRDKIQSWVATYQPDYILILLGFNDLGWLGMSPGELVRVMADLVVNARQGNPNVKILVGNVVQRTFIPGRQNLVDNTLVYNQLLKSTLPGWWRQESPIAHVDVAREYQCAPGGCPDGHDGLHPNGAGEYHIASTFYQVLKDTFHFPGNYLPLLTDLRRVVTTPHTVVAEAVPEGIRLAWNLVENNRGYEFRARMKGIDTWWSGGKTDTFVLWYTWVYDGQEWEFQVRTKGDDGDFSDWSGLVSAVAHPSTSPGPANIHVTPTGSNSFQIAWDAVSGYSVNRYEVMVWDQDTPAAEALGYAVAGTITTISGLSNGHRYAIWVSTWVNLAAGPAEGMPTSARQVTIGGGTPGVPSGFSATNLSPTTVHLAWSRAGGATGYAIYTRALPNGVFILSGTTTSLSEDMAWLYPGTCYYEFCVAAYNGDLESGHSCAIPPLYPGWKRRGQKHLPLDASNITFVSNTTMAPNMTNMAYHERLRGLWSVVQRSRSAASDVNFGNNSSIANGYR